MSDEGRLVAGRYRIVRRIGSGAMGAVWQAQDEVLARTVAIKQLLLQPGLDDHEADDAKQRTMREGRIAARLHHPNAITVFDVVTDDNDHPCLIMEYLESTSLAEVLREQKTLPPIEVAQIGAQIASALKEAHAVGIVHRDIKPGNILLADNGTVKITDFGISRAKDDVQVTKTGLIAGTPAYLAPEVAIGGEPGPEADVFSLGSTLYAACEGQPPFGLSENTLSLLHAVAAGQINPPRRSGPLASVLAVLLHPEVSHRPTAEESEELLAAVARGETPLGGPADETQIAPSAGGLAGALGAGAVGGVLGAAAADGATRAFSQDNLPDGHSGTLGGDTGRFYDDYDDRYAADDADYPADEYDRNPNATRAIASGGGYDDRHPPTDYDEDEDDEKPGGWKKPAAIGGVVLAGLVALGVWLFSSPSGGSTPTTSRPPTTSQVQTTESSLPEPSTSVQSATDSPGSTGKNTSSSRRNTTTKTTEPSEPANTPSSTKPPSSSKPPSTSSEPPLSSTPTSPTGS